MGLKSWAKSKYKKTKKKISKGLDKATDAASAVTGKAKSLTKELDDSIVGDIIDKGGAAFGVTDITGKLASATASVDSQVKTIDALADVAIGKISLNKFKNQAIKLALDSFIGQSN